MKKIYLYITYAFVAFLNFTNCHASINYLSGKNQKLCPDDTVTAKKESFVKWKNNLPGYCSNPDIYPTPKNGEQVRTYIYSYFNNNFVSKWNTTYKPKYQIGLYIDSSGSIVDVDVFNKELLDKEEIHEIINTFLKMPQWNPAVKMERMSNSF